MHTPDPDAYVAALTATGLAYAPALSARSSSSGEEDRPGAAVFWRADRWEALTVEFLATARGAGSVTAVVRVLLARASDGAPLAVLSAALPGGATTAAEAARLAELTEPAASGNFDGCFGDTGTPSVRQWFYMHDTSSVGAHFWSNATKWCHTGLPACALPLTRSGSTTDSPRCGPLR